MKKEGIILATRRRILGDLSGVKKLVENLPEEQKSIGKSLFTEIAFLHETLKALKERIDEEGPVIETTSSVKENPALKAYNTSIMRYSQLLKQLTDILPEPPKAAPSDPLLDFIKGDPK